MTPSIQPEPIALVDGGRIRDRDAVEAQSLAARFPDADQRGRLVVEREALRRLEGETEFWMNEGVVAHHALRRIVAEGEAVDGGEIRVAPGFAGPRRAELARFGDRLRDALGRRGMRRHHIGAVGRSGARDRSAKGAPLAERGEESAAP